MEAGGTRVETVVVVRNKNGLHARPSSMLAEAAMKFEATSLTLRKGDVEVDAKSIMELRLLEATCGTELRLFADHGVRRIDQRDQRVLNLGGAAEVAEKHNIRDFIGSHGLGHARMATESDVSPTASHPF